MSFARATLESLDREDLINIVLALTNQRIIWEGTIENAHVRNERLARTARQANALAAATVCAFGMELRRLGNLIGVARQEIDTVISEVADDE